MLLVKPCIDAGGGYNFGTKVYNAYHCGKDYIAPKNTNVYLIQDGIVEFQHNNIMGFGGLLPKKAGPLTIVKHTDLLTLKPFFSLYGHLITNFKIGDQIKCNTILGQLSDFYINGVNIPHLHFSIYFGDKLPLSPWGYVTLKRLKQYYDPKLFFMERANFIIDH